jgi:hypothetical protein
MAGVIIRAIMWWWALMTAKIMMQLEVDYY